MVMAVPSTQHPGGPPFQWPRPGHTKESNWSLHLVVTVPHSTMGHFKHIRKNSQMNPRSWDGNLVSLGTTPLFPILI